MEHMLKTISKPVSIRVSKTQYQFFLMRRQELKRKLLKKVMDMENIKIENKPDQDKEIYRDTISFRLPYQYYQKLAEIAEENQVKVSDIIRNILFGGE
ncbi:putative transcriptional regulator [Acidianus rod-shaped virus 3]|uniref:Putative transcriptional regulator n=1 Tax=Acidianus rod-shaped virus 3 TaxID=2730617 RepID=A0A6M3VYI0_9VIRU|nr:putative transcriptional regulator [Acidianus rod-shaped virus 3]QJF12321.1 putative transcriptional regulator [Acidianus rod-shaped virus 3]